MLQMLEIDLDVFAAANPTDCGNESDCGIGFDHGGLPRSRVFNHER